MGQSPTERQKPIGNEMNELTKNASAMTSITGFPLKPESASVSTSTDVIETQSTETLTEVRRNIVSQHHPQDMMMTMHQSLLTTIQSPNTNNSPLTQSETNLPSFKTFISRNKFSGLNLTQTSQITLHMKSKETSRMLSAIPEYDDSPTSSLGSRPINEQSPDSDLEHSTSLPQMDSKSLDNYDNEFINSEFYIEESLPSSVSSDHLNARKYSSGDDEGINDDEYLTQSYDANDKSEQTTLKYLNTANRCNDDRMFQLLQVLHMIKSMASQYKTSLLFCFVESCV